MLVRFFRFRPWAAILSMLVGEPVVESASSSHFWSSGFNLHIFLKLSCSASNRQIVVWENTFPYSVPSANPTSACVKPSLIRRCLNCLANASRSSLVGVSSSPALTSRSPPCRW
uniref:Putative beta-14-n-acetylgalactosaminyltransferase bre-4 n=1 Tax=Anopheles darlingi TaxID=43151 RepID=A0A2M4DCZ8_ANODA